MKKAAIDIGTNSTRLFIAEIKEDAIVDSIIKETIITGLGKNVEKNAVLGKAGIKKTVGVLKGYSDIIKKEKVGRVRAVATSAVRDAKNADDFLSQAKESASIDIEIIDGKKEAGLSFTGAISDPVIKKSGDNYLVIDIGGGSTEIVYGDRHKIKFSDSVSAGCVRFTEKYLTNDPPTAEQLKKLRLDLHGLLSKHFKKSTLAGIDKSSLSAISLAGTATSMVSIIKRLDEYDPDKVHGYMLSRERIEFLLLKLSRMKVAELKKLKGLHPDRANVIVAGVAIQAEIMEYFGLGKIIVSESDILNGILLDNAS